MNFNRFRNYTTEEFLEDPDFRTWIHKPTKESNGFWEQFLDMYPQQADRLHSAQIQMRAMVDAFSQEGKNQLKEQDLFRSRLLETMERAKRQRGFAQSRKNRFAWIALAASLLLLVAMLGWFWLPGNTQRTTYKTGFEEWKTIILPDESIVQLNANSSLKLDHDWSATDNRRVWLRGEAFFQVKHRMKTGSTFTVHTDDLSIEVLGTSFNVHSRGEQTNVFLEEGKIKLDLDGKEKYLDPGALVTYSARKNVLTEQNKALASKHISWKDGTLILKDTPTSEILNKVQEIYGVSIKIETEKINNQVKTVGVPMDKLEIAIPILERTLDVKINRVEDQLVIK